MAFDFEAMKNSIVSAGKEVGDRAKEASSVAKLKLDIHTKEDFLERQYAELGKLYYNEHKDEEDILEKQSFITITETIEEIKRLEDEVLAAQGAVTCPECGAKQSDSHAFCDSCGAKLK